MSTALHRFATAESSCATLVRTHSDVSPRRRCAGFDYNRKFTDDKAACMVLSGDGYVMLLAEPFFKTFTTREVGDTSRQNEALLALSCDSRAALGDSSADTCPRTWAISLRGRALAGPLDKAGWRRLLAADNAWGIAAGLWIASGPGRVFFDGKGGQLLRLNRSCRLQAPNLWRQHWRYHPAVY